jgi:hypothetical protein
MSCRDQIGWLMRAALSDKLEEILVQGHCRREVGEEWKGGRWCGTLRRGRVGEEATRMI